MLLKRLKEKRTFFALIIFAFSSIVFSCIKKEKLDTIDISPLDVGWALPLIDSELSLADIINSLDESNTLFENSDGSYTFKYQDTVMNNTAEDLFVLNNESVAFDVALPAGTPVLLPSGQTVTDNKNFKEPLVISSGSQVTSVLLKAGNISTAFTNSLKHNITATITVPSLTKNGVVYTRTFTSTFSGGTNTTSPSSNEDLNGYLLDLSDNNTGSNMLNYNITYTLTSTGQVILPTDKMSFNMAFTNLKFKNMRGSLTASKPNQMYNGNTSIRVFDNTLQADIYFDKSTVTITTENSFGIPLDLKINDMLVTTTDNQVIRLTADTPTLKLVNGDGTATVAAPTVLGQKAVNNNVINAANSNLNDVLNPAPNELDYQFTPVFAAGTNQFITDESRFLVSVKVEIPIFGILKKYTLGDTLEIEKFPKRSDKNWTVDSIQFTFKTQNSLPFDTYTQMYFVDSSNNIIDSLLTNPAEFIRRPVIDAQGKSIQAVEQTTIVQMGGLRYDKVMSKTKNIYVFSRILTSKDANNVQKPIQVFSYNKLRLTIGVLATGQIRPTE